MTINYLDGYSLSVVNERIRSLKLIIRKIILKENVYIPIQDKLYDETKFKENISINESYMNVDKYLGLVETFEDERTIYLKKQQYTRMLQNIMFQKIYLELKDKPRLLSSIHQIKYHPIKLRRNINQKKYLI